MKHIDINEVLSFLHYNPASSRAVIEESLSTKASPATMKRILSEAIGNKLIEVKGSARASRYFITPSALLLMHVNLDEYFRKEIDDRIVQSSYNFNLTEILSKIKLFNAVESKKMESLQLIFKKNIKELTSDSYNKEMERLAIDLSWKSSQIEGNTYSLLETERLLRDKKEARGKTKEEAIMLLNHKEALRFILSEPDYLQTLSLRHIEDIHSILIKDLNIDRHIRKNKVGITGTNYTPLDNEFQIREAVLKTCDLVNARQNVFEKALLILLLISYIQPFTDGNKRTARIVGNAVLIANHYCPLSFRSVDPIDYKKAMLLFYEQNNLSAFKEIFIGQCEFAVKTYF